MATDSHLRHLTSEKIQEFLDEGLPPGEEALVQEHLSVCPRCQSELEGWKLLFQELTSLPDLDPSPALSRSVLAQLPERQAVGTRVRGWLGIGATAGPPGEHLPVESLQDFVDGVITGRGETGARNHLAACQPCREDLKGWERLFGTLAALGRFAPAAGFTERVMARVRIPMPVPAPWVAAGGRALGWAQGFLPQTRRGWAVAGGIASAPTISMAALLYLVFSHPLLTAGTFTTYVSWKATAVFSSLFSTLASAAVDSVALFRAYSLLGTLAKSPFLVGIGGLAFSLTSAVALWILYRNLIATPQVESRYARARV